MRHPCVYHVVVARTYAAGNVLLPQRPRSSSLAARLNATAFIAALCSQLNKRNSGLYFLINIRYKKIKKRKQSWPATISPRFWL